MKIKCFEMKLYFQSKVTSSFNFIRVRLGDQGVN